MRTSAKYGEFRLVEVPEEQAQTPLREASMAGTTICKFGLIDVRSHNIVVQFAQFVSTPEKECKRHEGPGDLRREKSNQSWLENDCDHLIKHRSLLIPRNFRTWRKAKSFSEKGMTIKAKTIGRIILVAVC
jgi:hypothetical protein